MADRLADGDRNRQHGQPLANVGVDLRLRAGRAREVDVDLAVMDALGVLVELGAAGAAPDRFDLRHLREQALGDEPEPMQFRERNARIVLKREHERALVERRQKAARQQGRGVTGYEDRDRDRPDHESSDGRTPS